MNFYFHSLRLVVFAMLLSGLLSPGLLRADFIQDEIARLNKEFQTTDTDGNGFINREEYLKRGKDEKLLARDFKLFDFDESGTLTKEEFSCTPGVVHASLRGPIPDPVEGLRLAAIDALNESFDDWRDNPEREVQAQSFIIDYNRSISPDERAVFNSTLMQIADQDDDNHVNWDEAVQFVEVQLGVCLPNGTPVREPSGRVYYYPRFEWHDRNNDNVVTREEFLSTEKSANKEAKYQRSDLDQDGSITLEESASPRTYYFEDPIMIYRSMDTDLDGLVSREEMQKKVYEHRRVLIPLIFRHYDPDQDGLVTLMDYRMSPLGNVVCPWWSLINDADHDRKLRFRDFKYRNFNNQLLWRYYFSQFDVNEDKFLTTDEFPFKIPPPQSFHRLSLETGEMKELLRDENLHHCGSPDISHDGKQILFDGWGMDGIRESRIFLMTIDGDDIRELNTGLMPTWSPDGQQFACSRYDNGSSVWLMNIDGSPEKKIDSGWGAQFSPDGKYISYYSGPEIKFYDVEQDEISTVLTQADHGFRSFYWNMCWSHDGSRIAIKARPQQGGNYAIISFATTGEDRDVRTHIDTDRNPEADVAWFPDNKHLLITLNDLEGRHHLPYKLSIEPDSEPIELEDVPKNMNYNGVTISPDGKWVVIASVRED